MQLDYIIQGIIFSKLSDINISLYYVIILFIGFVFLKNDAVNDYIYNKIESFLIDTKKFSLTFKRNEKSRTTKNFKALMHYISTHPNNSIKHLSESVEFLWSSIEENDIEKFNGYRINQEHFNITNDIKGKFWVSDESYKDDYDNSKKNRKFINVEIFTYKLKLKDLIDWVAKRVKEYDNYLKRKTFDKQILLDVTYDLKENQVLTSHENWESNVTFDNKFFHNKDNILKKISYFLENKEWFKKKGEPYSLGFLLHGKPGCGKTSFIKALLNYTGRHGINIKLSDTFDMDCLKKVIQKEKINDYIIPIDNRILIFEDIDCMGNIVKKRKSNIDSSDSVSSAEELKIETVVGPSEKALKDIFKKNDKLLKIKNKNNLSYFLNILDGLIECNGRIIIMTTNKPDDLDPALIRPGRIDEKIEFGNVSGKVFIQIIEHFYELNDSDSKKLEEIVSEKKHTIDNVYTPAELKNICRGLNYEQFIDKIFN